MIRLLLGLVSLLIIFAILLPVVMDKPEHMKTDWERIREQLGPYAFNTPKDIEVLLRRQSVDQKTRERIERLILKTNEEFLPRTPRIPDSVDNVMRALRKYLPDYDFGEPVVEEGSYFHWLSPNTKWFVSSIETSRGHFSFWEKRMDVSQLIND